MCHISASIRGADRCVYRGQGKQYEVGPGPSISSVQWIVSGQDTGVAPSGVGLGGQATAQGVTGQHSRCLFSLVDKMEDWLTCPWAK